MDDLKALEAIMRKMAKRLEANPDDGEALAIFERTSELLGTLWKDEVR